MSETTAIILAAGVSSRMNTKLPKVLHEVCGQAMLWYVLQACRDAGISRVYVVTGYDSRKIEQYLDNAKNVVLVKQNQQKGTAHAVLCCWEHLKNFKGNTLVLCGDGPLIRAETLKTMSEKQKNEHSAAILATAILEEPAGYGRVIRDDYGNIEGIIEDSDCTKEQLTIKEVNPSYYLFNNKLLFETLEKIRPDNKKNEYYLTDAVSIMISSGLKVTAVTAVSPEEAKSVNDRQQLSEAGKIMQHRIQRKLMAEGVTMVDPANIRVDAGAKIGQDTIIEPFTYIQGEVKIGKNCRIGPFVYLSGRQKIADGTVLKPNTAQVQQQTK